MIHLAALAAPHAARDGNVPGTLCSRRQRRCTSCGALNSLRFQPSLLQIASARIA